jgi:hypothetical protein
VAPRTAVPDTNLEGDPEELLSKLRQPENMPGTGEGVEPVLDHERQAVEFGP